MDGVPGMIRLDWLCVPARTDSGPGALNTSAPPDIGSEPVSFRPARRRTKSCESLPLYQELPGSNAFPWISCSNICTLRQHEACAEVGHMTKRAMHGSKAHIALI